MKTQTIAKVAELVEEKYFDPAVASELAEALRHRQSAGCFDDAASLESLAKKLTEGLFELSRDKHLVVTKKGRTAEQFDPVHPKNQSRAEHGEFENYGVQRVEILKGNIGYLNLTSFYPPEEARDAIATAMHLLRHADALIIDVRENAGGSPDTTALFASYFFDQPKLSLFKIIARNGDIQEYTTDAIGPANANASRPTFLLTSKQTFSAGEGIGFLLQERHRTEVIGETTAGAANPGRPYDVNSYFDITIPNGRVVSAIRNDNWEGSGVKPDVMVSSSIALQIAHSRALAQLASATSDRQHRELLQLVLRQIENQNSPSP